MPHTLPAIRFEQNRHEMYVALVRAQQLATWTTVDHWSPGRTTGYQRVEMPDHVRKIANYIKRRDAFFPLAGILNVRERRGISFDPKVEVVGFKMGELSVADGVDIYVVDMQHRRLGLQRAYAEKDRLKDFPIPVVLIRGLSGAEEALQFFLVNQKSRKIDSGLALRILVERLDDQKYAELVGDVGWRKRALAVTILLNKTLDGPWKGRIREPNTLRDRRTIASERSFIPSLRPIIDHDLYAGVGKSRLADVLAGYWDGIEMLFPAAMGNPADYVTQQTSGVGALHRLFPLVFSGRRSNLNHLSRKQAREYTARRLQKLKLAGIRDRFWENTNRRGAVRFGTGFGAQGRLYLHLGKKAGLL